MTLFYSPDRDPPRNVPVLFYFAEQLTRLDKKKCGYVPRRPGRQPACRRRAADRRPGRRRRPSPWWRRCRCRQGCADCQCRRRCWNRGPCYPSPARCPSAACSSVGVSAWHTGKREITFGKQKTGLGSFSCMLQNTFICTVVVTRLRENRN